MTKSMSRPSRHALAAPDNTPAVEAALRVVGLLDAHALHVSPWVAGRLERELAGDDAAILQTATWMTEAQRRGTEALPDPLPLLDQVESSVGDPRLEAWEFEVLIAAAVCVDDRTELLLEASERPIAELIASGVSRHLRLVAGHFAFADPRMRVWVHGSASLAQRTAVHARLAEIFARHGERDLALWHRALCTLEGDAALVEPLLVFARSVLASGDAVRAHAIAREAASHAVDRASRDEANLLTGLAAAAAGFVDDAARRLAPVLDAADHEVRITALGAHLAAVTWQSGVVPEAELETRLAHETHDAASASALAAALLAERGRLEAAASWNARACRTDRGGAASALARSWLAVHAGTVDDVDGGGSVLGAIADALALGLRGDSAAALRGLAAHEGGSLGPRDDVIRGLERTPVTRAYRAVATTLLRLWAGDVRGAHEHLVRAAIELPVAVPFAGLALPLMRRLELAIAGDTGVMTRAIDAAVPHAVRGDALMDAAIADFLADRVDEASMRARVHHELRAASSVLWVPGVDEVGPLDTVAQGLDGHLPPDAARACRVRALARSADRAEELEEAAELARTVESPFERGRAEAAIAASWAVLGDHDAARRHLVVAESLLDDVGADAWSALARRRRERLAAGVAESLGADAAIRTGPWREVLTERELEVTLLVIEGASNREIAERLYVSVRTVEVHVGRILAKLGVRSRVELTVLAHRVGLST
ncbi:MAG: LuxR C-terminal-related transcriptional regulator [Protaetiibacter sp.]